MTDPKLLNYVEEIYKLELEQSTISQIIKRLNDECQRMRNQIQEEKVTDSYSSAHSYSYTQNIQEEKVTANYSYLEKKRSSIGAKILIGFGAAAVLGAIASTGEGWGPVILYLILASILLFAGVSWLNDVKDHNHKILVQRQEYIQAEKRAAEEAAIAKQKAKEEEAKARQKAKEEAEKRLEQIKQRNQKIRTACSMIERTEKDFEELLPRKKQALQHMYDYDIIHRNYRNLYAISKIYQLLDTGICDSLTGVDGAYAQMRIDKINDDLETIIALQQNNLAISRMMLSALSEVNHSLDSISQQLDAANSENAQLLQSIKDNVEVSNFLIQSGNDDRKALASSADYLAFAEKQRRLNSGYTY